MQGQTSSNSLGVNVPKLRFPGFEGEWDSELFSDLFTFLSNNTLSRAELSDLGNIRNVHYGDILVKYADVINVDKEIMPFVSNTNEDKIKCSMLRTGDVIIADTAEDDTAGKATEIINQNNKPVVSGLHTMPCRPKRDFIASFLGYYINSNAYHSQLYPYMQGIKVTSISKSNIGKTRMSFPSNNEQKKIVDFFNLITKKIETQERLVELLKLYKRGLLTKLFPQKGESVPQYRFEGFTEKWEQRRLGDMADIIGGGTPSTDISEYWDGDIDWYVPAEIADKIYVNSSQRKITEQGFSHSSAKLLPVGTVLFTSRAGIGKTAILAKKGCTNQGFQSIVPYKGALDSYFIFARTEELKRYGETVGAGSTFVEVSGKQLANMELMMPKTMEEQKTIGSYFCHFDHLITLHQERYSFYEKVKSALLQQMFI